MSWIKFMAKYSKKDNFITLFELGDAVALLPAKINTPRLRKQSSERDRDSKMIRLENSPYSSCALPASVSAISADFSPAPKTIPQPKTITLCHKL